MHLAMPMGEPLAYLVSWGKFSYVDTVGKFLAMGLLNQGEGHLKRRHVQGNHTAGASHSHNADGSSPQPLTTQAPPNSYVWDSALGQNKYHTVLACISLSVTLFTY